MRNVLKGIALSAILFCYFAGQAQMVTEATKKRASIAVGLFTDIWRNYPSDMKIRTINQGFQVNAMYNMPFGKSNVSFAIGLGVGIHNLYWNYLFNGKTETLQFSKIPDNLSYTKSKITLPYLEIPVEFRLKTKMKLAFGIGFKVGYLMDGHAKWVGKDYLFNTNNDINVSFTNIKYLERISYGPTLRIGYKWFHLFGYYQLSAIFKKTIGPEMAPVSIGFLLMPY